MICLETNRAKGFDYIAGRNARAVILGSMPGVESLRQQQYYAHPRNSFWDLMGAHQCERNGSLDSNIKADSVIPNNFNAFFAKHPDIKAIFFNGRKAADIYQQRVLPNLPEPFRSIPRHTLPSTSPAHAAMSPEAKLEQWLQIIASTDILSS
jgi:G:T/U-mismatch repair DNA glycosylase